MICSSYTLKLKMHINHVCTVNKINKRLTIFICLFNIRLFMWKILKWYSLLISCLQWRIRDSRQRMKITFELKWRWRFKLIILYNYNKYKHNKRNENYTHYLCFCLKSKCLSSDMKSVFFSVEAEKDTTRTVLTAVVIVEVIHVIYESTWILEAYEWWDQRSSLLNCCLKEH